MLFAEHNAKERSTELVNRLPAVIKALNNEPTRLTGKKPIDAIKNKSVAAKPSLPSTTPEKPILGPSALVCYLYSSGELEGGSKRATDPVWSMSTHNIVNVICKTDIGPSMYYLVGGPARGFMREELQVIPADTKLPPKKFK